MLHADTVNHRIQILNEVVGWLLSIEIGDNDDFKNPVDLAFDPQGNIHVVISSMSSPRKVSMSDRMVEEMCLLG